MQRRPELRQRSAASSPAPKRRRQGEILCGINAVGEALKAGARQVTTLWVAEHKTGQRLAALVALATTRGVRVEAQAESRLTAIAGTPTHQGVVAFLTASGPLTLKDLIERLRTQTPIPPVAVLDGVKDPRNLGAIIRSAAAFGIGGVVLRTWRAVGLTATVAKAAAGGLEHIAVAEVANLSQGLTQLKAHGFWVIGADERGEVACDTFQFPSPLALVLGEEGKGVSPLVKRHCDVLVRIPLRGPLRSLNVSVAAGVLFYAVATQRQG
jgi:23S rRNA (guanosine2251-2'-O)-methyltransferase